ncbi:MAG: CBS domain-containing protein [Methyloligella sp. ZOD6]
MKVKEMMHKGVQSVSAETPIGTVASKMKQFDIGAVPVERDGELIGMITDRDIAIRCFSNGKDISAMTAGEVMSADPIYCRDNEEVEDAVRLMESKEIRRLPVLDEAQAIVGMVSLGDISQALPRDISGEMAKAVSAHHP